MPRTTAWPTAGRITQTTASTWSSSTPRSAGLTDPAQEAALSPACFYDDAGPYPSLSGRGWPASRPAGGGPEQDGKGAPGGGPNPGGPRAPRAPSPPLRAGACASA